MIEQRRGELTYLQFKQFLPYTELVHGIFTRQGGYSEGEFSSLNTSAMSGKDRYPTVARNRELVTQTLGIPPQHAVTLWQVHGVDVRVFDDRDEWRTDWDRQSYWEQTWTAGSIRKGDALITKARGTALALSFADCTPLVFYDPGQKAIGLAHGGWRGTARGIAVATIEAMQEQFACRPEELLAGIGPTIGPCCYEVGETLREFFLGKREFEDGPTPKRYRNLVRESAVFSTKQLEEKESLRLDLQETQRNQLLMAGLRPEHIEGADICTSCQRERFFSHRGEGGRTGRFPVLMMLKEEERGFPTRERFRT